MTTIVREESTGSSALAFVLAILVLAAVGFGFYYFSGVAPHTTNNTTINVPEPKAPSLPEAPSMPAPEVPNPTP